MKKFLLTCLLFPASTLILFSKGLRIADSVIFKVPDGWEYIDSTTKHISGRGTLTSARLENPTFNQKLTVSVLKVDNPAPSIAYSDELIEATFAPWIEAAREQGMHPNPGRSLARNNFIFYSQELGHPNARKMELRGVLMQTGDDWVNFFCTGSDQISWQQYKKLITGTQLLKTTSHK